tara:strand:- start:859 stop:1083 length:225 start_codon:yes stop_codon:yes gene_type:complete
MKESLQNIFNQSDSDTMVYLKSIKFTLEDDVSSLTKVDCLSYVLLTSILKRIKNISKLLERNIINLEIFWKDIP